jgi:hypothetical protein
MGPRKVWDLKSTVVNTRYGLVWTGQQGVDFRDEIPQMLLGGPVLVLEAYLDESERTGGVFCIAGYLFVPRQARRFAKEWTQLFGPKGAHMVDLCARRQQFKDLSRQECNRLIKEAVKIIKYRMTFGPGSVVRRAAGRSALT